MNYKCINNPKTDCTCGGVSCYNNDYETEFKINYKREIKEKSLGK